MHRIQLQLSCNQESQMLMILAGLISVQQVTGLGYPDYHMMTGCWQMIDVLTAALAVDNCGASSLAHARAGAAGCP